MTEDSALLLKTIPGLRHFLRRVRSTQTGAAAYPEFLPESGIGLVPTMGALHAGHRSLIQRARQDNALVVVSLFVNPLQFGPGEDFERYPRLLDLDRQLCDQEGVDVIFAPSPAELLAEPELTQVVPPPSLTQALCGRSRPGHFQGVATIVTKLLNLVQPDRAYFGQKDAQQLAIIRRLVADLNLPVEIVPCPTLREPSGLAWSSRNQYLNPEQRQQATVLYRSLQRAKDVFYGGSRERQTLLQAVQMELATEPGLDVEYVDLVDPDRLTPLNQVTQVGLLAIAGRMGSTRLIDNLLLYSRRPILAIDGPAGAGKSTIARRCAQALGLLYLDTGAMYRAVTWLVLQSGIAVEDEVAIADLVSQCQIDLVPAANPQQPPQVLVDGQDVTQAIRSLGVTAQVSAVAAQPSVRQELVKQQRRYGQAGGIVVEGRDIGTYVFPNAELKIFLTASVPERARRRQQELKTQGEEVPTLEELELAIFERDCKDANRAISPLRKAADAIEINTDRLSIAEVTEQIVDLYRQRFCRGSGDFAGGV